jgi:hypothetical protein
MTGLLPPQWPLVDEDGSFTQPWYSYFKNADDAWRSPVQIITTASTVGNADLHLIPNNGLTYFNMLGALTTDWILEPPEPGKRKTIAIASPATTLVITLASTDHAFRPGTGWKLTFPSSSGFKVIDLIGATTERYFIVSNPGGAVVTT